MKQVESERKLALLVKKSEVPHYIVVRQQYWVSIEAEWDGIFLAMLVACAALTLMVHEFFITDQQTEIIKDIYKFPWRSL